MALVKVKAMRLGYYNHRRVREDAIFMMDEKDMKKDEKTGKFALPSWVTLAVKKVIPEPEPETSHIIDNDEVI